MPEMQEHNDEFSTAFEPAFEQPTGICFVEGSSDRLLVVDHGAHCVKVVNAADCSVIETFGERGSEDGQFKFPRGVSSMPDGGFVVADTENHRIQLFAEGGNHIASIGRKGTKPGLFSFPYAVVAVPKSVSFWPSSETEVVLVVADQANHRCQILQSDGKPLHEFGADKGLNAIAPVEQLTTSEELKSVCYPSKKRGLLRSPFDVCVAQNGTIIVADYGNHRVQLYTSEGVFIRSIGKDDSELGVNDKVTEQDRFIQNYNEIIVTKPHRLRYPSSVCVNAEGSIFVGDSKNRRVAVYGQGGEYVGSAASAMCGNGWLGLASAIDGKIAVTDAGNNRVCLL